MGVSEKLGGIYAGIEDKFYSAMDFLSDRGIPVYSVIDPLEQRGIPALPVFTIALVLLAFFAYGLIFLNVSEVNLKLSIASNMGDSLSGVSIQFSDESGKAIDIGSTSFRDAQTVKIPRGVGTKISLKATKNGYDDFTGTITLRDKEQGTSIVMKKTIVQFEGAIRLVDSGTNDLVQGATITVGITDEAEITCFESAKGIYTCPGVFMGEGARITITHPNYEQKSIETSFDSAEFNEIELVPKAGASQGKSNLIIRTFDFNTKERIGNFTARVYDAQDNELISELTETDGDGEQIIQVSKGTSIRIVVEKQDYITYDSSVMGENLTLRSDEEKREVYIKLGNNALTVSVIDATGRPLTGIGVYLYNKNNDLIGEKETSLAGEVVFENLSQDEIYYASAWEENYVPSRETIDLTEKNRVSLMIEKATATNSGSLTIYTANTGNNALADVTLNFLENTEELGLIPLGIPAQKTDIGGKFVTLAPLNANMVVNATKGTLEGQGNVAILQTFGNEIFITMKEPYSEVNLKILGEDGKEAGAGFVSVSAGNESLFEGEYEQGGVIFNPTGNKYVTVIYTDEEGNEFSEEVYVEKMDSVSVQPKGKSGTTTTPDVEFLGVTTIDGTEAKGISKGIDYFLKFRVVFPEGNNKNGLHVRFGEDSVRFADSQDAGIIGYSASGGTSFYGRSYSPEPSPGFEALDFENQGEEGKYNKFAEIYFSSGGEKIVKIRVKAKETATSPDTLMQYRAWSTIGNIVYRTPADADLGLEAYSNSKTGLYADTMKERIRLLESSATCTNELCASYKFVRSDGSEFGTESFKAILEEAYALEINIAPEEGTQVTVKAATSKQQPKIGFQGFGINDLANFPDTNNTDTSIEVENVPALEGETTGVRLFFKPFKTENSFITLQLIAGSTVINEQFYFEVYEEKNIIMKTVPENVVFGEDFVIALEDEDGASIENAEIILNDYKGQHLETISGNASSSKGAGGRYAIKNSFDTGTLKYEIRAERLRPAEGTIDLTKKGMIAWGEETSYLIIRKDEKTAEKFAELLNNSKQNIQEIVFDVKPVGQFPDGMSLAITPVSLLQANSSQRIVYVAEYTGDLESAHAEAIVTARGVTETGYTVLAQTRAIIDYNPKIPSDCVEFSKSKLAVYVASGFEDRGYYDATYGTLPPTEPTSYYAYNNFSATSSTNFTAKLADKSECQSLELELTPEIVMRQKKNEGIEIDSETIVLSPQFEETAGQRTDSDEVIVSITNKLIRNYPGKEKFDFDIVYKGDGFEKTISVEVYIWNPRYALLVSRNIEIYLGPDDQGNMSAQVPLFVRNIGEADIENVDFQVSSASGSGNVDVRVVPSFAIQFLKKGAYINPPKTIVAQALRNEKTTILETKELSITGVIDGTTFDFGPVILNVHISAAQCLKAVTSSTAFYSTKSDEGALTKEITLRNTCAEPVRLTGLSQPSIGNNKLSITQGNTVIPAGATTKIGLQLSKREDYQGSPVNVYVKGFLINAGKPIESSPITVDIKLGKDTVKDAIASEPISIPICGADEKAKPMEVRFPKMASDNSPLCDSAYCDASQLADYLAKRIEQSQNSASRQVQAVGGLLKNSGCIAANNARGFCTFEELGVPLETFSVYLSNDALSPELLEKALEKTNSNVKSYGVSFIQGDESGTFLGGYSRTVYMNSNFSGCGKYNVTLRGSVKVDGFSIIPDLMNIVIDLTPNNEDNEPIKQETEQCAPLIQNFANFTPKDTGLIPNQSYGSWLGVVEATSEGTIESAKGLAKKLFGSEDRFANNRPNLNRLKLELGAEPGYLVKIEMDKTQVEGPRVISAFVRQIMGDEKLQIDVLTEASNAIAGLRNNSVDGCIAEDESYILIKSAKDTGDFSTGVSKTLSVAFEKAMCVDANVSTSFAEKITLAIKKEKEFDGINEPFLALKTTDNSVSQSGSQSLEIMVDKIDAKSNQFKAEFLVCAIGNSDISTANGNNLVLSAKRKQGGKAAENKIIKLDVSGVHPLDFVEMAGDVDALKASENSYYATFVWKGEPESITIEQLGMISRATSEAEKSADILENGREIRDGDTPEEVKRKTKASNAYLASCSATSALTSFFRPTMGIAGAIFNAIFDCGIPYAYLMWGETDVVQDIFGTVQKLFKPVTDAIKEGLSWLGGPLIKAIIGTSTPDAGDTAEKGITATVDAINKGLITDKDVENKVISALIPSTILETIITSPKRIYSVEQLRGIGNGSIIANNITDDIVNVVNQNAFGGKATQFSSALKKKLSIEIEKELANTVKASTSIGITGPRTVVEMSDVKAAVEKAIATTEKDNSLLTSFYKSKSTLTGTLKASSVADEAADALVRDIDLVNKVNGSKVISIKSSTQLDTAAIASNKQVSKLSSSIKNDAIKRIEDELGGSLPSKLKKEIAALDFPIGESKVVMHADKITGYTVNVTDDEVKRLMGQIDDVFKRDVVKTIERGADSTGYEKAVAKKFSSLGVEKAGVSATDELIASARPRFWSIKGMSLLLKNLVKESLFAAASNAVGLWFYDTYYDYTNGLGGIIKALTPEEEQKKAFENVGSFEITHDPTVVNITKYYTYPIAVSDKGAIREIKIMPFTQIPSGTPEERILKSDNPFAEEVGEAFLGILPTSNNIPKAFITRRMENEHVQMVRNYLTKNDKGERIGVLVASAVKDSKQEFFSTTGLNLEAMVASIGVVKTGLGNVTDTKAIFGCGINTANPASNLGIYANAKCAADKIVSYVDECTTIQKTRDASCYFEKYKKAEENQQSDFVKAPFTPEEFTSIYTAWNSNPLAAAGS